MLSTGRLSLPNRPLPLTPIQQQFNNTKMNQQRRVPKMGIVSITTKRPLISIDNNTNKYPLMSPASCSIIMHQNYNTRQSIRLGCSNNTSNYNNIVNITTTPTSSSISQSLSNEEPRGSYYYTTVASLTHNNNRPGNNETTTTTSTPVKGRQKFDLASVIRAKFIDRVIIRDKSSPSSSTSTSWNITRKNSRSLSRLFEANEYPRHHHQMVDKSYSRRTSLGPSTTARYLSVKRKLLRKSTVHHFENTLDSSNRVSLSPVDKRKGRRSLIRKALQKSNSNNITNSLFIL